MRAMFLGLAVVAPVLVLHTARAASRVSGAPQVEWTKPEIVIRTGHSDTQGYAATAFHRRAYIVDVTDRQAGGRNVSRIWFSTNRSGRWNRTLVAKIVDDQGASGVTTPRIVVVPSSGHVVIAAIDYTASGSKLLSFSDQSGSWQPLTLPLEVKADSSASAGSRAEAPPAVGGMVNALTNFLSTHIPTPVGSLGGGGQANSDNASAAGTIEDAQVPSLAAYGDTVDLAFNANYAGTSSECSKNEGNVFLSVLADGEGTWSSPKNVTADLCQTSLFARSPILAYSPSGRLYLLYERTGDPSALRELALRSGTLAASTEQIVASAPASQNWGVLHSLYGLEAIAFDARGGAHVTYITSNGENVTPPRLMFATGGPEGWGRTLLHQATKRWDDADVASVRTAIAAGETGTVVAFEGTVDGAGTRSVYLLTHHPGQGWSSPENFTGKRDTDTSPKLAVSEGLMHLFIKREGVGYLYARQLPLPTISEQLQDASGDDLRFRGSVAPETGSETVRVCLQHKIAEHRWGKCQRDRVVVNQVGAGQFTYRPRSLAAGRYRVRATVQETDDHLSGIGPWQAFTVR